MQSSKIILNRKCERYPRKKDGIKKIPYCIGYGLKVKNK